MTSNYFILLLFLVQFSFAQDMQEDDLKSEEIRINRFVTGNLLTPSSIENPPLVILIQGSGPTDRNGNQSFMKNDSFKKLARELAANGIASFRYDKRIFEMSNLGITEEEIRFDDFIADATSVLEYFGGQDHFGKKVVLGHSQGSLVGMISARNRADAFISIAGAGHPIDALIVNQLKQQMPGLDEQARESFEELRKKGSTSNYNPALASIFKPGLQAFMLSWLKYDPAEEISKLDIPVLVLNGTEDLQVSEEEAEKLKESLPGARIVILENMNHVFREIAGDDLENSKSYNEPRRPLHPDLVPTLENFIHSL